MPYEPVVKVAASVKATRVRWLWPKYVARGQVTILDGDPGTGKSFITMDLAARVSRGDVMPGGRYKGDPALEKISRKNPQLPMKSNSLTERPASPGWGFAKCLPIKRSCTTSAGLRWPTRAS